MARTLALSSAGQSWPGEPVSGFNGAKWSGPKAAGLLAGPRSGGRFVRFEL